ncbi:MAG: hypothetical protein WCA24_07085, partial [Thiomonas sp.]
QFEHGRAAWNRDAQIMRDHDLRSICALVRTFDQSLPACALMTSGNVTKFTDRSCRVQDNPLKPELPQCLAQE